VTSAPRRTGRRPGDSGTREAILDAARQGFGTTGYAGTSVRAVARSAGVDPALVHHFFGTKDGLFAAALELPLDPATVVPELLEQGLDGLGTRLVGLFLTAWDATPGQGPMLALLRSAVSDERSAASLRDLLSHAVLTPLARACAAAGDPELRACLAASQVVGLAVARYVVRLEPLASTPPAVLATAVGPTVDRYLSGTLR
jgi:AcrR family transcriptional regulator